MNTKTKLNTASFTASIMLLVGVFSKPLHLPELLQWVLLIGVFIPLVLVFRFTKELKRRNAETPFAEEAMEPTPAEPAQAIKKRLWVIMACGCIVGLCGPLWLPWTGTTLGGRGDFVVGMVTAAFFCVLVGLKLRKL